MKKIMLALALCLSMKTIVAQSFMHGAGFSVLVGTSEGGEVSVGEGLTYSPRFNFIETEGLSLSVGIPLTLGISYSTEYMSYGGYYNEGGSVGFIVNVPLMLNLNMGRGSSTENTSKFGYFIGAGYGYHHGDFLVDDLSGYLISESVNATGPAANAGFRIGVGGGQKNIEVRFSYMKGLNENRPNLFGVGCAFNF